MRLARFAPEIVGERRRSMFRIHPDVRFSKDKSPSKTHAAAGSTTGTGAGPSGRRPWAAAPALVSGFPHVRAEYRPVAAPRYTQLFSTSER